MRSFLEAEEDVARMRDFVTKNNRISASGIVLFIRTQVIYSYQTTLLRTLGYTRRFFSNFLDPEIEIEGSLGVTFFSVRMSANFGKFIFFGKL